MPAALLVTGTVMVQLPFARAGTVRLRAVEPYASVVALVTPTQVPPMAGGLETKKLESVSVKLQLVRVRVELGLLSVKVRVEFL